MLIWRILPLSRFVNHSSRLTLKILPRKKPYQHFLRGKYYWPDMAVQRRVAHYVTGDYRRHSSVTTMHAQHPTVAESRAAPDTMQTSDPIQNHHRPTGHFDTSISSPGYHHI
jgi:hypothetical protein